MNSDTLSPMTIRRKLLTLLVACFGLTLAPLSAQDDISLTDETETSVSDSDAEDVSTNKKKKKKGKKAKKGKKLTRRRPMQMPVKNSQSLQKVLW